MDRSAHAAIVVILALSAMAIAGTPHSESAPKASTTPPCDPSQPNPPLIVALPDGTQIPAASIHYDTAARYVTVIGSGRVFCDTFEGG